MTEVTSKAGRNYGRLFSGYYRLDSLKFHKSTSSTEIGEAVRRVGNFVTLRYAEEVCHSWISRRWDVGIWTGLGWPRIETGGGRL